MSTNPWTSGVLPRKFIELVGVALNAACTNLNPDGTRRHIRAALHARATREEILFVLKAVALMSIHSCSLGAPILIEEVQAVGSKPNLSRKHPYPPQRVTPCAPSGNCRTFGPARRVINSQNDRSTSSCRA